MTYINDKNGNLVEAVTVPKEELKRMYFMFKLIRILSIIELFVVLYFIIIH